LAKGVPASAFCLSLYNEDIEESGRFLLTLVVQELFVEGAKELMSETSLGRRPADEGKNSSRGFISSHVSATTAGVIKLWELYPDNIYVRGFSLLSVCIVGYQRIDGDHHTPLQVGLGVGTAFLFDWLGDKVSEWLRVERKNYVNFANGNSNDLFFSIGMTPDGTGAMGVITYTF